MSNPSLLPCLLLTGITWTLTSMQITYLTEWMAPGKRKAGTETTAHKYRAEAYKALGGPGYRPRTRLLSWSCSHLCWDMIMSKPFSRYRRWVLFASRLICPVPKPHQSVFMACMHEAMPPASSFAAHASDVGLFLTHAVQAQ